MATIIQIAQGIVEWETNTDQGVVAQALLDAVEVLELCARDCDSILEHHQAELWEENEVKARAVLRKIKGET